MNLELLREYLEEAKHAQEQGHFNSSVVLHHRAFDLLLDEYLLQQTGQVYSSHYDKFQALKQQSLVMTETSSFLYYIYRDSYQNMINPISAEAVQSLVYELVKAGKFEEAIPKKPIMDGDPKTLEVII